MWAPVQIMWAGSTDRVNDCGPGRVFYCEPSAQLVRAATSIRGFSGVSSLIIDEASQCADE